MAKEEVIDIYATESKHVTSMVNGDIILSLEEKIRLLQVALAKEKIGNMQLRNQNYCSICGALKPEEKVK